MASMGLGGIGYICNVFWHSFSYLPLLGCGCDARGDFEQLELDAVRSWKMTYLECSLSLAPFSSLW
jgi:hypothetical protein